MPNPSPSAHGSANSANWQTNFLNTHNVTSSITKLLENLLEHRPNDPLLFTCQYLRSLADEEDRLYFGLGSDTPQTGGGKKLNGSKGSKGRSSNAEVGLREGGVIGKKVGWDLFFSLRCEMERWGDPQNLSHFVLANKTLRKHSIAKEILASVFERLQGEGVGASVNDCCEVLERLAEEMKIPQRASSLLLKELTRECQNTGSCSFLQFSAAGRSLSMLPEFLKEAERLCKNAGSRTSDAKKQQQPPKQETKLFKNRSAAAKPNSNLSNSKSQSHRNGMINSNSNRNSHSNRTDVRGLRDAITVFLDSDQKSNDVGGGVFDLVDAAIHTNQIR